MRRMVSALALVGLAAVACQAPATEEEQFPATEEAAPLPEETAPAPESEPTYQPPPDTLQDTLTTTTSM